MSNIWKFSSLSKPYVENWLQKVVAEENKWSEKFKHVKNSCLEYYSVMEVKKDSVTEGISNSESLTAQTAMDVSEIVEEGILVTESYDENFCNIMESEPLSRIEYMIEKCLRNPKLISELAQNLSTNTIEKICNTIFTNRDINTEFIQLFLINFFPTFLKRDQSWLALDLLTLADKTYPEQFKPALTELIKNIDIKSSVLQEFMENSNIELRKHFISVIMHMNMTPEMFLHHLHTIYTVYKDYEKTENVQFFIQTKLIENAANCIHDKNYGRLFFTYLQAQKTLGLTTNCTMMETVIEQHKSNFKRPCVSILNEMKE